MLLKAVNQSLNNGQLINATLENFMLKFSASSIYPFLLKLTIPFMLIYSLLIAPFFFTLLRILEPCEDFKLHRCERYNEEKTLTRLANNLQVAGFHIIYGFNIAYHKDIFNDYYLEAFKVGKRLYIFKQNIYIKVFVYNQETLHEVSSNIQNQIETSIQEGIQYFAKHGGGNNGFILPMFIFNDADLDTKKLIVSKYLKIRNIRVLPCLYNGNEDWWYHKREKKPIILSVIKKLERSINDQFSNEEFNEWYDENYYFLKGHGYSYYKQGLELLEFRKYKDALWNFLKAIKQTKNDRDVSQGYLLAAICYENLNQPEEAAKAYKQCFSYNSQNYKALSGLAIIYTHMGDYEQAIRYYEDYFIFDPEDKLSLQNYQLLKSDLNAK
jgi:tetratricopeptide (TPR) repeat protein